MIERKAFVYRERTVTPTPGKQWEWRVDFRFNSVILVTSAAAARMWIDLYYSNYAAWLWESPLVSKAS